MDDFISIKAINVNLIWNQSIGSLMKSICYRIGFIHKTIRLYIGHGSLNNNISFWQAEAGVYDLDSINTEYFDKLHFSSVSPEDQFASYITENNKGIYILKTGSRKTLNLYYVGTNKTVSTDIQLMANSVEPYFDTIKKWKFDISQIREYLTIEDHRTYYDWSLLERKSRKRIHFKEVTIFGITSDKFSGAYNPETNELLNIELNIGVDVSNITTIET